MCVFRLQELMNVDFDIRVVSDGNFGKKIGEKWNGMIGEVIDGVSATFYTYISNYCLMKLQLLYYYGIRNSS